MPKIKNDKTAIFPGSFDPITLGHLDIIERSLPLFDKIIIGIGQNTQKKSYFPLEKRVKHIKAIYKDQPKIEVKTYAGLTVEFCKSNKAKYIIRGLRTARDFDYERTVAQLNRAMASAIESIFLISRPEFSHISSTIVREIMMNKGDISAFVPKEVMGL